ncbi:hypothetical protein [Marinomonas spartinae]|uniref:hypothetical protein n=1 Tax=Marinomonas spartinae TaxID=1792290 RepID=UPI0018F12CAF|nr:hypothetical protein [Marinomonas spartinae]MBJ7555407.1 hypothetical protein [Marinomonas spartinae]
MSLEDVENAVKEAIKAAETHAGNCVKLINDKGLKAGIDYCTQQGIDPPQCSLTAVSKNADNQRAKASRMLCEVKWWSRRLKDHTIRNYENTLRSQGKVTKHLSNDLLAYHKKHYRVR